MYIGIDIGGTNIRVGSFKSLITPQLIGRTGFSNSRSYRKDRREIIQAIQQFDAKIDGIGIAMPGRLSKHKTTITSSSYIHQWHHRYLAKSLASVFDCPVIIDHDSKAAALGEALYGRYRGVFARVGYGTGLCAAIINNASGRVHVHDLLGKEFNTYLAPWQNACGGRNIEREFGKPADELHEHEWQIIINRFNKHLLQFIETFNPSGVILGGGVAVKQADRLQLAFATLKAEYPEMHGKHLAITSLGEDEGLYGALGLLRRIDNLT